MSTSALAAPRPQRSAVPLSRLVRVELRKMFDTRSGAWLLASIAILAALATLAVILLAPAGELRYSTFAGAVGFPMTVLLPVVAVLSVTGEWSQRTGLITFTLAPHRGQVILAKAIAAVAVGVLSMLLAFALGALGNVVGSAIKGVDASWDVGAGDLLLILLAQVLGLLVGFMLGVLFRSSAAALVAYLVYAFVLPSVLAVLAATQRWFADIRPWVDLSFAQGQLFNGRVSGEEWANLAVSGFAWLLAPLVLGLCVVLRSEVK